jgi:hypothetical protein
LLYFELPFEVKSLFVAVPIEKLGKTSGVKGAYIY